MQLDNSIGDLFCKWDYYTNEIKGLCRMDQLETIISVIDYTLSSKGKRHIVGGVLISMSLLLGGLAFTVLTLKTEEETYEQ